MSQKQERADEVFLPVPLVVVAGFLGAGKTTFVREVLPLMESKGLEPYVIINDYANARVDAASLAGEGRAVVPITGNCICCDSIMELMTALMDYEVTERTVVVVEANGTSDPASLIEHLLVNPQLREKFSPLMQVTVVDPQRWQRRRGHNELERLQVETASHLLVTRRETTPASRFEEVLGELREVNARAVLTNRFDFTLEVERIRKWGMSSWAGGQRGVCGVRGHEGEGGGGSDFGVQDHDGHGHEGHDHGAEDEPHHAHAGMGRHGLSHAFVGMELDLPEPMKAESLQRWLCSLPVEVLRVKGLVRLEEEPGVWFQFHRVDAAEGEAELVPLSFQPSIPSCAVLIGVKLDEGSIRQSLAAATGGLRAARGGTKQE